MKTPTIRLCLRFYPERHAEHREIAEFFRAIRAGGRQGDVGRHVEAALLAYLRGQPAPRRASAGLAGREGPAAREPASSAPDGARDPALSPIGAGREALSSQPAGQKPSRGEGSRGERSSRMASLVRNIHRDLTGPS